MERREGARSRVNRDVFQLVFVGVVLISPSELRMENAAIEEEWLNIAREPESPGEIVLTPQNAAAAPRRDSTSVNPR